MNEILAKQLAIDFCTDVNSILSKENVFTEYKQLEGRRIFKEGECYFKAASVNGKIVASGRKDIIQWAREEHELDDIYYYNIRLGIEKRAYELDYEMLHFFNDIPSSLGEEVVGVLCI